ncbi:MAG TPA: ubiquinone/menaquinone biosynthesis methyltransferase [Gemmatimonadaceae bacterium]|nr:ubiquinone/menaquinone biosynthesis methyltransferase [Gemmatimonadaceae bacterium]
MMATEQRQAEERSAREAASGSAEKRSYVRAMFSDIAPRYDLLNHVLSLNIDRRWRRRAIRALQWEAAPSGLYLDLCAGTLDVAVELSHQPGFNGRVIGADFAEPMLRAGVEKVDGLPVHAVTADALTLPIADATCAGAIVAFGVRNLADLDAGLREVARVLAPGARFVILEFTTPRMPLVRSAYHLYFHHVLPWLGGIISGNRGAYRYLPQSVAHFPSASQLAERMRGAGLDDVRWQLLSLGIAAIHVGRKS